MRRFHVTEVLGRGGHGLVLRAREHGASIVPEVALKLLPGFQPEPHELQQRLRDEARALSLLRHPSIVRSWGFVELDVGPALILEYGDGVQLTDVIRLGTAPPCAAVQLIQAVWQGLDHAWCAIGPNDRPLRLVHRDIKPANLVLCAAGEVRVLDFGLMWANIDRESRSGPLAHGTPAYMAPERRGNRESATVDVFSVALVLWNLLTGRFHDIPPEREAWEPWRQDLRATLVAAVPDQPGLAQGLGDLFIRATAWAPEERLGLPQMLAGMALAGLQASGEDLRSWAARTVPAAKARRKAIESEGTWVGRVLIEADGARVAEPADARSSGETWPLEAPAQPTVAPVVASAARPQPWRWGLGLALGVAALGGLWRWTAGGPPSAPVPAPDPAALHAVEPGTGTQAPAPSPAALGTPPEPTPSPPQPARPRPPSTARPLPQTEHT